MTFDEIFPALRQGAKVRRESWCEESYIYLAEDLLFRDEDGDRYFKMGGIDEDLLGFDWEVAE